MVGFPTQIGGHRARIKLASKNQISPPPTEEARWRKRERTGRIFPFKIARLQITDLSLGAHRGLTVLACKSISCAVEPTTVIVIASIAA